jgi:hypothetical protein
VPLQARSSRHRRSDSWNLSQGVHGRRTQTGRCPSKDRQQNSKAKDKLRHKSPLGCGLQSFNTVLMEPGFGPDATDTDHANPPLGQIHFDQGEHHQY